jgi:hypothetical protein
VLTSNPLQFDFKPNIWAGLMLYLPCIEYRYRILCYRGNSVYAASLDIDKAFDHVHHFKLFSSCLMAGVPVIVVDLLCDWYGKLLFKDGITNYLFSIQMVAVYDREIACHRPYFNI